MTPRIKTSNTELVIEQKTKKIGVRRKQNYEKTKSEKIKK